MVKKRVLEGLAKVLNCQDGNQQGEENLSAKLAEDIFLDSVDNIHGADSVVEEDDVQFQSMLLASIQEDFTGPEEAASTHIPLPPPQPAVNITYDNTLQIKRSTSIDQSYENGGNAFANVTKGIAEQIKNKEFSLKPMRKSNSSLGEESQSSPTNGISPNNLKASLRNVRPTNSVNHAEDSFQSELDRKLTRRLSRLGITDEVLPDHKPALGIESQSSTTSLISPTNLKAGLRNVKSKNPANVAEESSHSELEKRLTKQLSRLEITESSSPATKPELETEFKPEIIEPPKVVKSNLVHQAKKDSPVVTSKETTITPTANKPKVPLKDIKNTIPVAAPRLPKVQQEKIDTASEDDSDDTEYSDLDLEIEVAKLNLKKKQKARRKRNEDESGESEQDIKIQLKKLEHQKKKLLKRKKSKAKKKESGDLSNNENIEVLQSSKKPTPISATLPPKCMKKPVLPEPENDETSKQENYLTESNKLEKPQSIILPEAETLSPNNANSNETKAIPSSSRSFGRSQSFPSRKPNEIIRRSGQIPKKDAESELKARLSKRRSHIETNQDEVSKKIENFRLLKEQENSGDMENYCEEQKSASDREINATSLSGIETDISLSNNEINRKKEEPKNVDRKSGRKKVEPTAKIPNERKMETVPEDDVAVNEVSKDSKSTESCVTQKTSIGGNNEYIPPPPPPPPTPPINCTNEGEPINTSKEHLKETIPAIPLSRQALLTEIQNFGNKLRPLNATQGLENRKTGSGDGAGNNFQAAISKAINERYSKMNPEEECESDSDSGNEDPDPDWDETTT